jgi:drug/metabolite transporter (DMT)-like permease
MCAQARRGCRWPAGSDACAAAGERPVLAVVLALAAALGYGSSDFAAGLASRGADVIRVTLLAEAASAVTVVVALLVALPWPHVQAPSAGALAWGAAGGLAGAAGALALYAGFRQAAFSVAAPLSAVAAAGFSVLAGVLLGERPAPLALAGIGFALPAIAAVSYSAAPAGTGRSAAWSRAGVGWGLAAGACFALLFIALNRAAGSGLWPVACAQVAALAGLCIVATVTRAFQLPAAGSRRLALVTGVTGAGGTILYFLSTHQGLLAVTAVITSLYPAVTIVLARAMLGERMTRARLAGLILAAAAVSLIAAAGASGG